MAEKQPHRLAFTTGRLQALQPPASGRQYVYDTRPRGLTVCVTSTGSKTFYLYRKANGRPVRVRIGKFPDVPIDKARTMAAELTGDLAHEVDLVADRRRRRQEHTLGELFTQWLEVARQASSAHVEGRRAAVQEVPGVGRGVDGESLLLGVELVVDGRPAGLLLFGVLPFSLLFSRSISLGSTAGMRTQRSLIKYAALPAGSRWF